MSNEENTPAKKLLPWEGAIDINPPAPAIAFDTSTTFSCAEAGNITFVPSGAPSGKLTVHGIEVGSADELASLVRDARRFRKLSAYYCDEASGRPTHGAIQLERWDAEWMDWVPLSNGPLAEIADALPEVEQP